MLSQYDTLCPVYLDEILSRQVIPGSLVDQINYHLKKGKQQHMNVSNHFYLK